MYNHQFATLDLTTRCCSVSKVGPITVAVKNENSLESHLHKDGFLH